MKRDYEINENNEINENKKIFDYFVIPLHLISRKYGDYGMKRMALFIVALVIATIATSPARPQQGSVLEDLKRDAIGQIDKLQVFTQQMVDQVFSYSELGFHEYETTRYLTGILEKNGFKVE